MVKEKPNFRYKCSRPFIRSSDYFSLRSLCVFMCGRRLLAECDLLFLHLYMCINDCPPFPSAAIKVRLTIVNQLSEKLSILKGD